MKRSTLVTLGAACILAVLASRNASAGEAAAKQETQRAGASTCKAHAVRTTSAGGDVSLQLVCDGTCPNDRPCAAHWLRTPSGDQLLLVRSCYCDGELKPAPCCAPGSPPGAKIRDACRIALAYPPDADKNPDGSQSALPLKDPTGVFCINDCNAETTVCKPASTAVEKDGVKVEILSCKCYH